MSAFITQSHHHSQQQSHQIPPSSTGITSSNLSDVDAYLFGGAAESNASVIPQPSPPHSMQFPPHSLEGNSLLGSQEPKHHHHSQQVTRYQPQQQIDFEDAYQEEEEEQEAEQQYQAIDSDNTKKMSNQFHHQKKQNHHGKINRTNMHIASNELNRPGELQQRISWDTLNQKKQGTSSVIAAAAGSATASATEGELELEGSSITSARQISNWKNHLHYNESDQPSGEVIPIESASAAIANAGIMSLTSSAPRGAFFMQSTTMKDELQEIIEGISFPDHLSMTSISNSTLSQMGSTPQRTLTGGYGSASGSFKPLHRSSFTRDTPLAPAAAAIAAMTANQKPSQKSQSKQPKQLSEKNHHQVEEDIGGIDDPQIVLESSSAPFTWSKSPLHLANSRNPAASTYQNQQAFIPSLEASSETLAAPAMNHVKQNLTTFGGGDGQRFHLKSVHRGEEEGELEEYNAIHDHQNPQYNDIFSEAEEGDFEVNQRLRNQQQQQQQQQPYLLSAQQQQQQQHPQKFSKQKNQPHHQHQYHHLNQQQQQSHGIYGENSHEAYYGKGEYGNDEDGNENIVAIDNREESGEQQYVFDGQQQIMNEDVDESNEQDRSYLRQQQQQQWQMQQHQQQLHNMSSNTNPNKQSGILRNGGANIKNPSSRTSYVNMTQQPQQSRSQLFNAMNNNNMTQNISNTIEVQQLGASSLSQSIHTYDPNSNSGMSKYNNNAFHNLKTSQQMNQQQQHVSLQYQQNVYDGAASGSQFSYEPGSNYENIIPQQQQQQQEELMNGNNQLLGGEQEFQLEFAYRELQIENEQLYHQVNYLSTKAKQAEEQSQFAASQIEDLELNLKFLQEKYKEDGGNLEKLRGKELETERANSKRLKNQIEQKNEKISSLFNEMQKLEQHREAYLAEFKNLSKARITDRQQFEQYEFQLQSLHSQNQELLFSLDSLQAEELDKLRSNFTQRERALTQEISKANKQISAATQKEKPIEENDSMIQQSPLVTQLLNEIDELKARGTVKDLELKHLSEDLAYSQEEILQFLQSNFGIWINSQEFDAAPLAQKLDILKNRVQELRYEIEGYEVSLSETRKQSINRATKLHQLKGENTRLKEEVLNLSALEDTSQINNANNLSQINNNNVPTTNPKLRLSHLNSGEQKLPNQQPPLPLPPSTTPSPTSTVIAAAVATAVAEKSAQLEQLQREYLEQQQQDQMLLAQHAQQIKSLLSEKRSLESTNTSLQHTIESQQEQIETISSSSENIIAQLEDKLSQITRKLTESESSLQERIDRTAKDKDRLDRLLKDKENSNADLQKENQMLLDNVNHLKNHYESMQSQLKASVASLQAKQEELQQQIENSKVLSRTNRNLSQTNIELLAKISAINDSLSKEAVAIQLSQQSQHQIPSPSLKAQQQQQQQQQITTNLLLPPYHNKAKSTSHAQQAQRSIFSSSNLNHNEDIFDPFNMQAQEEEDAQANNENNFNIANSMKYKRNISAHSGSVLPHGNPIMYNNSQIEGAVSDGRAQNNTQLNRATMSMLDFSKKNSNAHSKTNSSSAVSPTNNNMHNFAAYQQQQQSSHQRGQHVRNNSSQQQQSNNQNNHQHNHHHQQFLETLKQSSSDGHQQNISLLHSQSQTAVATMFATTSQFEAVTPSAQSANDPRQHQFDVQANNPNLVCSRCEELAAENATLTSHFERLSAQMLAYDSDFNEMKSMFIGKLNQQNALINQLNAAAHKQANDHQLKEIAQQQQQQQQQQHTSSPPSSQQTLTTAAAVAHEQVILPEMLSKEETLDLLGEILRKVLRSDKMKSAILQSSEFVNLLSLTGGHINNNNNNNNIAVNNNYLNNNENSSSSLESLASSTQRYPPQFPSSPSNIYNSRINSQMQVPIPLSVTSTRFDSNSNYISQNNPFGSVLSHRDSSSGQTQYMIQQPAIQLHQQQQHFHSEPSMAQYQNNSTLQSQQNNFFLNSSQQSPNLSHFIHQQQSSKPNRNAIVSHSLQFTQNVNDEQLLQHHDQQSGQNNQIIYNNSVRTPTNPLSLSSYRDKKFHFSSIDPNIFIRQ